MTEYLVLAAGTIMGILHYFSSIFFLFRFKKETRLWNPASCNKNANPETVALENIYFVLGRV